MLKMTINGYQQAAMRTASGMNYENHGMLMNYCQLTTARCAAEI